MLIAGGLGLIVKLSSSNGASSATSASGSAASQPYHATRSPAGFGPQAAPEYGNSAARPADSPLALWVAQTLSKQGQGQVPSATLDQSCLSDPAVNGNPELAIASGTYNGAAALLVVYANPNDPATVLAVVYATPCSATHVRVLDKGLVAKPTATSTP